MRLRFMALTAVVVFCGASDSPAAVWSVLPGQSIQSAVQSAADGDSVIIHDGVYHETTVLYGKRLTIGSLFLLDGDSAHIEATIVSADTLRQDTSSSFVYAYGEPSGGKLAGLTMTGGQGTYWHLADSTAGGAVFIFDAATFIENCNFNDCSASHGGAVAATFDNDVIESKLEIRDSKFRRCSCNFWGGAVYAAYCSLSVSNCLFDSNSCGALGAGAWIMLSSALIDSCVFSNGLGYSGGLSLWDSRTGNVRNCNFRFNRVYSEAGTGSCDLEFIRNGGEVRNCTFSSNAAPYHSAFLEGTSQRPVRFVRNVVEHNLATTTTGTIAIANSPQGDVAYNLIRNNSNESGGAIYCFSRSSVRIHHNVIVENFSANSSEGSAVKLVSESNSRIDSNLIAGNFGETISQFHSQIPLIDARNNWWGDPSGPYHPTLNPGGLGDTLFSDSVLFEPWLTEPPDTTFLSADPRREPLPRSATWQLLSLYPNPFNHELTAEIAGFTGADFSVTLHNLLGQQVARLYSGRIQGGRVSLAISNELSAGIYFVRCADKQVTAVRKVLYLK